MRRNRVALLVVLALVGLGVAWVVMRQQLAKSSGSAQSEESSQPVTGAPYSGRANAPQYPPASRSARTRSETRSKRDALREQIVRALENQKPRASAPGGSSGSQTKPHGYPPGNLRNRIGGRQQVVDYLNQDFMPLAKECIEHALERTPRLTGMLGIGIEIVADEELGGVIDRAEPAPNNEVPDDELIECIRQTALSVTLPARLIAGREKFQLTLRVASETDAGQPR